MNISYYKIAEHAPNFTYGATASTAILWGLHLSDVAVIVSALAAVGGFALQAWVAWTKVKLMQRSERWKAGDKK